MLVLSRQRDETILIGDDIEVTVVDIRGDKVRLGINAPKVIPVHRKEVADAIQRESRAAAQLKPDSDVGKGAAGLDDALKDGFIAGLAAANGTARKQLCSNDPQVALDAAKAIASIVRTAVQMEAQVQSDEHVADKCARLDAGKTTERFTAVQVIIPGLNTIALAQNG